MSEQLGRLIHETIRRIAVQFNYGLGRETSMPWEATPERYKLLMGQVGGIIELEYFSAGHDDLLGDGFYSTSGYGAATKKPFILLSYNGRNIAQMGPEDAQRLARDLMAVAEASIGDAFLLEFFQEKLDMELSEVTGLMLEFRQWRDNRDDRLRAEDDQVVGE